IRDFHVTAVQTCALPIFGSTHLEVSRVGLGTAALGRPAYINLTRELPAERSIDELRRRTHLMLDAAYGLGVRYFDTARSYGHGEDRKSTRLNSSHVKISY